MKDENNLKKYKKINKYELNNILICLIIIFLFIENDNNVLFICIFNDYYYITI
jgi:hypothetical protein